MYEPKQQYVTSINAAATEVYLPRQVECKLDSVNGTLDMLHETACEMIRRLEPVTGGFPDQTEDSAKQSESLVPVAARINYINSRLLRINENLRMALNALEI